MVDNKQMMDDRICLYDNENVSSIRKDKNNMEIKGLDITILEGKLNDKPVFRNLMQYYQYDMSEYSKEDPNTFGQFDYKYLDHYWTEHGKTEEGRTAYLVKVNDQYAGFVLVNNFSLDSKVLGSRKSIAEFFILKKWRKNGIGKMTAFKIFDTYKGQWEIKQMEANLPSHHFWLSVVDEYTKGQYERIASHLPEWTGPVLRFKTLCL